MRKIDSVNNQFIKKLAKLQLKKYRDQAKKFLIEGYHMIEEATQSGLLETVLICDEIDVVDGPENIIVTEGVIEKLAQSKTPQKIIGVCRYFPQRLIDGQRFLLLDDIQDPGNLGTLIRSALGFKVDCVIVSPDSVDIYNDKALRATQGAIFKLKVINAELLKTINHLKSIGIRIYGTSPDGGTPLSTLAKEKAYALVLGNESRGVSKRIEESCNRNIYIEINNKLDSLNVAVAGSIIMYYFNS
ncbi:MAG: RNA methyltransferase [Bacilli bacterium]|nr:RNA methyltransferase [Bacilli bacterium]MDD4387750.1 RNA methyltransferase [Bacilli bacterium]